MTEPKNLLKDDVMVTFQNDPELWIETVAAEYRDKGYEASPIVYRDPLEVGLAREFLRVARFKQPVCVTCMSKPLTLMVICLTNNDDRKIILDAVKNGKRSAISAMNPQ